MTSAAATHSSAPHDDGKKLDPALRAALRYTISTGEYRKLHAYLSNRASRTVKSAPPPGQYEAAVQGRDDFNAAAVRAALRTFVATQAGLRFYDLVLNVLLRRQSVKYGVEDAR